MKRDLETFTNRLGRTNSLQDWYRARNPLRVVWNFVIITLAKYCPSMWFKNILYRGLGVKIGRNVTIALEAVLDVFFPEKIRIGDNVIIGYKSTILTHEFLLREFRKGPVRIGNDVTIGAWTLILPGVTIGDGARVAAYSLVNRDVKPGEFAGGVPIRTISR